MNVLPPYGLRAYALLYRLHGTSETFGQNNLDKILSKPMKKKTFALLVKAGWLEKIGLKQYRCISPEKAIIELLNPRVPDMLKSSKLPYTLSGESALKLWTRHPKTNADTESGSIPYFIKVLRKDLQKWKTYLGKECVPNYVETGRTIGEYAVLIPVAHLRFIKRHGLKIERLWETIRKSKEK